MAFKRSLDTGKGTTSAKRQAGFSQQQQFYIYAKQLNKYAIWGRSSPGRALEWHSRGKGLDPPRLHQFQGFRACSKPLFYIKLRVRLESINMQFEHAGYKDEELMTDYQFRCYEKYRDRCEALEKELAVLRREKSDGIDSGMTDLQFLEYKRACDELAEAKREIEMLRGKQNASDSNGMADYQFKYIMGLKDENTALKKELEALRSKSQIE